MLLNTIQLIVELELTSQCVCICVFQRQSDTHLLSNSDGVPDNVSGCLSNGLYTQIVEESMQIKVFQSHKYRKRDKNKIW